MLVSELIKELKKFQKKHGDLPVYHTIGFVADVEIDDISLVRAHQCMLGNYYLDNYTIDTEGKIIILQKDMKEHAKELCCTMCEHFSVCSNPTWINDNVFSCFSPKNHIINEKIYRMQHYLKLLESELEKNSGDDI